ncbi:DNA-binding domain-containing protein [Ancylobacter amanitiformis]|uniref:Putative DNA-binding domain-containing protein n=1 Tax=Ancylobacter amanitiformis TaxID=217069 RepID=A0ABU0LWC6_9HYPH|nr:DNA-binding domain-containing protein [Ancylobacter amanitiformis]MDQ0513001.1 hypothetical protein [Ancylobacter amanitiformis]
MSLAASQEDFAQALLHAERPLPAGITTARGQPDAARFAVYRNNVYVGLTKALAQRFPVTERLVGAAFFTAMARLYAQDNKPASPRIIDYGDDFPAFIAAFEPAAELAYLADVARLEAAWTRAYHAADAALPDLSAVAAMAPDALPNLRLAAHPSAALIRSPHPVGSIWGAHQSATVPPMEAWDAETVLVVRPDMDVNVHIVPAQDGIFAQALFGGAPLGEAAEAAFAHEPAFDFGAALVGLHALGAFAGIHQGDVP